MVQCDGVGLFWKQANKNRSILEATIEFTQASQSYVKVQGSQKQLTMQWLCSFWQVQTSNGKCAMEVPKKELTFLSWNKTRGTLPKMWDQMKTTSYSIVLISLWDRHFWELSVEIN
jgi:hypothetical protein